MARLHLAISQTENSIPYVFPVTGIRVYSLEEALYHCLLHWRQSTQDFLCDSFVQWVDTTLGLEKIAAELRKISLIDGFSAQFLAFLSVIDYLPQDKLAKLHEEVVLWERRQIWERLAEQGDYWISRGEPEQAYGLYAKALSHHENAKLLNSVGVALMGMGAYDKAVIYFSQAVQHEPGNMQLRLNLIEAHIFAGDYESAKNLITEETTEDAELYYFQGNIQFENRNFLEAAKLYEKALKLKYDPAYIYKLCDCYMATRLYDKAFAVIDTIQVRDSEFLRKQAEYFATAGDISMAANVMESALAANGGDVDSWIALARHYRLDYNPSKATAAIQQALALAPENPSAMLEQAKISKVQGYTKEYQNTLSRILSKFKRDYRNANLS